MSYVIDAQQICCCAQRAVLTLYLSVQYVQGIYKTFCQKGEFAPKRVLGFLSFTGDILQFIRFQKLFWSENHKLLRLVHMTKATISSRDKRTVLLVIITGVGISSVVLMTTLIWIFAETTFKPLEEAISTVVTNRPVSLLCSLLVGCLRGAVSWSAGVFYAFIQLMFPAVALQLLLMGMEFQRAVRESAPETSASSHIPQYRRLREAVAFVNDTFAIQFDIAICSCLTYLVRSYNALNEAIGTSEILDLMFVTLSLVLWVILGSEFNFRMYRTLHAWELKAESTENQAIDPDWAEASRQASLGKSDESLCLSSRFVKVNYKLLVSVSHFQQVDQKSQVNAYVRALTHMH